MKKFHFSLHSPMGGTGNVTHTTTHKTFIKFLLLTLSLISLTIIPLLLLNTSPWLSQYKKKLKNIANLGAETKCDIFRGNWVPFPEGPYYSNSTCILIFDQQNCMKFGRPDTDFLKWRWKPDGCELPVFDAVQFLNLVRGKSMDFVGDSVGRNHVQSLLCLLATAVYPLDVSYTRDPRFRRWLFKDYNFTVSCFWAPHLVKEMNTYPIGPVYDRMVDLHLDEADGAWADKIEDSDYVIFSAGQWFYGPQVFYENRQVVGCYRCFLANVPSLGMFYGYKRAFRTAFQTLWSLQRFKGMAILRTFSPAHFENGQWNSGGSCRRTRPLAKGEMKLEGDPLKFYKAQVEELKRAHREGRKRGLKFRLLDTSQAMVLRPDGHPNHNGHAPEENVTMADCVHWCLPGPIDTWNELLYQLLKMES